MPHGQYIEGVETNCTNTNPGDTTMNWIHDYRTPDTRHGEPYTIRVLCDRCTPTHPDVEIACGDVQESSESCDSCACPTWCPDCGGAIDEAKPGGGGWRCVGGSCADTEDN